MIIIMAVRQNLGAHSFSCSELTSLTLFAIFSVTKSYASIVKNDNSPFASSFSGATTQSDNS